MGAIRPTPRPFPAARVVPVARRGLANVGPEDGEGATRIVENDTRGDPAKPTAAEKAPAGLKAAPVMVIAAPAKPPVPRRVPPVPTTPAALPTETAVVASSEATSSAQSAPSVVDAGEGDHVSLATGTVIAGKYRLQHLLKAGGMGAVWVATHLTLDTAVAIKFMSIPVDESGSQSHSRRTGDDAASIARARFEREARSAAQIRSANVVQILDYGVDRATAYIVMELLEGQDLEQRLRRGARLPLDETVRIVVPVLQLLQRAHDAGMVHRDLKPANIFLAKDGEAEVPKVLDFGVAKAVERTTTKGELTADRTIIGTPSYASPEQLKNSATIDHRADLWSMGVVIFRMLTGRKLFRGGQLVEVIVDVCTAPLQQATSLAPDLPAAVDAFFVRALSRDPDGRFQSAREMAQALTALVGAVNTDRALAPVAKVERDDERGAVQVDASSAASTSVDAAKRPRWLAPTAAALALAVGAALVLFAVRSNRPATNDPPAVMAPAADVAPVATAVSAPSATPTPASTSASATAAATVAAPASATPPSTPPPTPHPVPAPSPARVSGAHAAPRTPVSREDKEVGY